MRREITIILVGISLVSLLVGYLAAAKYLPAWFSKDSASVSEVDLGSEMKMTDEGEVVEEEVPYLPGQVKVSLPAEAQVNQEIEVQIVVNTGGKTISGFDILLEFDPQAWAVLSPEVQTDSTVFTTFPKNEILPQEGKINFSGLADFETGFTGEKAIGSFLLRPQKAGKLNLSVVFNGQGAGDDTNLAEKETGEDVLGKVENGVLQVK